MQRAWPLLVFLEMFFTAFIMAQNIQRAGRFLFPGYSHILSSSISKTQGIYHKSFSIDLHRSILMPLFLTTYPMFHALFTSSIQITLKYGRDWRQYNYQCLFFFLKIWLQVRTGKSWWTVFIYQQTTLSHLFPLKELWVISIFKYSNKMHSLSWDFQRKIWKTRGWVGAWKLASDVLDSNLGTPWLGSCVCLPQVPRW